LEKSKQREEKAKSTKNEKPRKREKPLELVTQFEIELNIYRFLHGKKKTIPHLPFKANQPLIGRIENIHVMLGSSK
jgi:hypothetical protein